MIIMKKVFALGLILSLIVGFTACGDDDDAPFLGATVNVTVKDLLKQPVTGQEVYMYKNDKPTDDAKPADALMTVITNDQGIAKFDLNLTQLNITESSTNLYLAIFYPDSEGNPKLFTTEGITVKRNDVKALELDIIF